MCEFAVTLFSIIRSKLVPLAFVILNSCLNVYLELYAQQQIFPEHFSLHLIMVRPLIKYIAFLNIELACHHYAVTNPKHTR